MSNTKVLNQIIKDIFGSEILHFKPYDKIGKGVPGCFLWIKSLWLISIYICLATRTTNSYVVLYLLKLHIPSHCYATCIAKLIRELHVH